MPDFLRCAAIPRSRSPSATRRARFSSMTARVPAVRWPGRRRIAPNPARLPLVAIACTELNFRYIGRFPVTKRGGSSMSLITAQLPVRLTPLVGRESELHDIVQAVTRARLLTLTGPGGTGKTRLALAAARSARESFAAGVCWVELAQIEDPGIVGQTLASRLGVPDTPGQDPAQAVAEYVADHQILVVLDNCEHLAGATAGLTENLLAACPALTVLATSREALA